MKNTLPGKLLSLSHSLLFALVCSLIALGIFIFALWESSPDILMNSIISASGAFAFIIIWVLLYRLEKDRKAAKIARFNLDANEMKYRGLIENAGIITFTTSINGMITFASSKAVELTGYTLKELSGMNFSELLDFEWLEVVKDKYQYQLINNIPETLIEFCIRTKFGDLKWVEQSAVLIRKDLSIVGFQCIIKDISDQREQEEIDKKFETVLGKADAGDVDEARAKLLGGTDQNLVQPGQAREPEEIAEETEGETPLMIPKFSPQNSRQEFYPIAGTGEGIITEETAHPGEPEDKEMEALLHQFRQQFLENMEQGRGLALNGIQGMVDLVWETHLKARQYEYEIKLKRSSDHLLGMIQETLNLSNTCSGIKIIEKTEFKCKEVLEKLHDIINSPFNEKELVLHLNIARDVPYKLNGDPYRLYQILEYNVRNAVKFLPKGAIDIGVSVKKNIGTEVVLEFLVTTTVPAMEKAPHHLIPENLITPDPEAVVKYPGVDAGLPIIKQLVEMQHGQVTVEGNPGGCDTFRYTIPYENVRNHNGMQGDSKNRPNGKQVFAGKKFLVAEADEVNQKLTRQLLQKAGGLVDITHNGLEVVSSLKKGAHYDLIFMDLDMPEMDGFSATRYIRDIMKLSIPIIATTDSALKAEKAKCLEAGMNDYVSKPFDFDFLYRRIKLVLTDGSPEDISSVDNISDSDGGFDLRDLEKMDDDEYLSEIISVFLNITPHELKEMKLACDAGRFETIYKISHKLKNSAALFKAYNLFQVLSDIEKDAKRERKDMLIPMVASASIEYHRMEIPLKEHLKKIQARLGVIQ